MRFLICYLVMLFSVNSISQNYLSTPLEYSKSKSSINLELLQKVAEKKEREYKESQKVSCNYLMLALLSNYETHERAPISSSSMLASVDYYTFGVASAVIAYIKQNENDRTGTPYIFCNISKETWANFIYNGKNYSWGKSFHLYIFENRCNCK